MKFWLSIVGIAVVGLSLAGCETAKDTAGVDPQDAGYAALNSGDYAKARDIFAAALAKSPHDPWLQLDLGMAYQDLGQMSSAEPYYRQVLVDGRNVVPATTTNASDRGKDLAAIACQNLKLGLGPNTAC